MRVPFFSDFFVFLVSFFKLIWVYLRRAFGPSVRRVPSEMATFDPETGNSLAQLTRQGPQLPPVSQKLPDPPLVMKFDGFDYDARRGIIRLPPSDSTAQGRIEPTNSRQ